MKYDDSPPYQMRMTLEGDDGSVWTTRVCGNRKIGKYMQGYMINAHIRNPINGSKYKLMMILSEVPDEPTNRQNTRLKARKR